MCLSKRGRGPLDQEEKPKRYFTTDKPGKHRSDALVVGADHNTTQRDPSAPQDVYMVVGNKSRELLRLLPALVPRRCQAVLECSGGRWRHKASDPHNTNVRVQLAGRAPSTKGSFCVHSGVKCAAVADSDGPPETG
jgi:hypothetical protein